MRRGAVLQWHDLDLKAVPGCEVALPHHYHEARVALGLDHSVLPRFELLPRACSPDNRHEEPDDETSRKRHDLPQRLQHDPRAKV